MYSALQFLIIQQPNVYQIYHFKLLWNIL